MKDIIRKYPATLTITAMIVMLLVSLSVPTPLKSQVPTPAPAWVPTHISTNTTTTIATTRGMLHTLVINTSGQGSNTLTLYDGTAATGTVLAVVNGAQNPNYLQYDMQYNVGLTVVSSLGTSGDFTFTTKQY